MDVAVAGAGRSHPRWLRRLVIVLAVLVGLAVLIRIVLDPIAGHYTRQALNKSDAVSGDFARVHVTILPPGYEIHRLKVIEAEGGDWRHPLFYAEWAKVSLDWRRLFHAEIAARLRLESPKITVTQRATAPKKKTEIPDMETTLGNLIPARIDRIEVRDGEFLFRDLTAPRHPEIWVHGIELATENLATRPSLAGGRPATINAAATLGHSGELTLFVSADPFNHKPDFAGNVALRGWKVAELYDLEQPATKLQTPEGTLDLFAEFKSSNGVITGGVKPVLKNVKVRPAEASFGNKVKAWIADNGLHLFSDRVPDRNAVATVIPIKGRLEKPDVQLWPTVLGVVRNAFVEGISSGFSHLPPSTAPEKEGPVKQATHALEKDKGPPKAQPGPAGAGKAAK
jgi:hypothetical protein